MSSARNSTRRRWHELQPTYQLCAFDVTPPATSDVLAGRISGVGDILLTEFGIRVGTVQTCQLPSAWKKVGWLTFAVEQSSIPNLRDLTARTGHGLSAGTIRDLMDDFVYDPQR